MSKRVFVSKGNPHTLSTAILHGKWAVHDSLLPAAAGLAAKIIQGETPDFSGFKKEKADGVEAGYTGYISPSGRVRYPWNEFDGAVEGSIGLIEISGTMLKADNCDDGMDTMSSYLYKCYQNPNIVGVLLLCDSGGGQVSGTEAFADAVSHRNKPVVAWVNGMAASACYWVASQADMIVMNGTISEVGSIGILASAIDLIPYWEAQGVKVHTILADGSEDKNKSYFEMLKGNYDLVKAELTDLRSVFVNAVKTGRAGKLKNEEMFSGKMFNTAAAIANGMADKQGMMGDAIKEIRGLAKSQKYSSSNNYNQSAQEMSFSIFGKNSASTVGSQFAKLAAMKPEELKAEAVHKLNETLEASESPLRVVGHSDFDAVNDGGASLRASEERVSTLEARVRELEAENEKLGKKVPNAQGAKSNKNSEEPQEEINRADYGYMTDEEFEEFKQGKIKAI